MTGTTPTPAAPASKPGTPENPEATKLAEDNERLRKENDELKEEKAKTAKLEETAKSVQAVLGRRELPEPIAARVREHFKTTAGDEAAVTTFLEAELAHARALLEDTAPDIDVDVPALDVTESGSERKETDGKATLDLAESAISGACGVLPEKEKSN